mmetsp:Transcript_14604/g.59610  ORF Transcript_14604/g.59610 Transcript_14604/m.59610 type:complete len:103 (+) Transcript_14604:556-864(+)
MVLKELEQLDDSSSVYKLIGSVLIKQGLLEARGNVTKRLEFIQDETDRLDKNIRKLENEQDVKHKEVRVRTRVNRSPYRSDSFTSISGHWTKADVAQSLNKT